MMRPVFRSCTFESGSRLSGGTGMQRKDAQLKAAPFCSAKEHRGIDDFRDAEDRLPAAAATHAKRLQSSPRPKKRDKLTVNWSSRDVSYLLRMSLLSSSNSLDLVGTPSPLLPRHTDSLSSHSSGSYFLGKATVGIELLLDYLSKKSFPRSYLSSDQKQQQASILSLPVWFGLKLIISRPRTAPLPYC